MAEIIIDGSGAVFGRLCSFTAKKALEGSEIVIVNSEKVIITGNKKDTIEKYRVLKAKGGHSQKGPKHGRVAFMLLKRGIRGMLPDHRRGIGKQAFLRIKCYDGVPEEFKDKKMMKISAPQKLKYIELKELVDKL
jgi:large subunit ribosomal protein L13